MFTLVCAIIPAAAAAAGAVPLALVQEDDITSLDDDDDLARGIISDVFDSAGDGSSTASGSVRNEATVEPNQETKDNSQQ